MVPVGAFLGDSCGGRRIATKGPSSQAPGLFAQLQACGSLMPDNGDPEPEPPVISVNELVALLVCFVAALIQLVSPQRPSLSSASSSVPAPLVVTVATPVAKAKAAAKALPPAADPFAHQFSPKRFYVILRNPRANGAGVGIHNRPWSTVIRHLPNQTLSGSGAIIQGFITEAEAVAWWSARCTTPPTFFR